MRSAILAENVRAALAGRAELQEHEAVDQKLLLPGATPEGD